MVAYIEVEERNIWIWQVFAYWRDGWTVNKWKKHSILCLPMERCIG